MCFWKLKPLRSSWSSKHSLETDRHWPVTLLTAKLWQFSSWRQKEEQVKTSLRNEKNLHCSYYFHVLIIWMYLFSIPVMSELLFNLLMKIWKLLSYSLGTMQWLNVQILSKNSEAFLRSKFCKNLIQNS